MTVVDYVTEEVRRQGHDVTAVDGLERIAWMLHAWCTTLRVTCKPTLEDAIYLGRLIEPYTNLLGIRTCGVRVGQRICPKPDEIPCLLLRLFEQRDSMTPLEFYKEFEEVHPFADGNGRVGKILLNWLNGTLKAPIFPPADMFGTPIINP